MSFLRLLAILVGLAVAQPAMAHAVLTSSEPAEGAVLMRAPGKVELRFNEPVQLLVLRLIDARGATHELAANSLGDRVEAAMPDGLPEGTQILSAPLFYFPSGKRKARLNCHWKTATGRYGSGLRKGST